MVRKFVYDGREFPDQDPSMSIDEVRMSLAGLGLPELSNAKATTVEEGDDEVTTFTRNTGTKGTL